MEKYKNRQAAGKILANALQAKFGYSNDLIVLALPRGGVPVAYEIAKALQAPLDLFIVRKLGVPGHSELAMGAIAMGNVELLNEDIIQDLLISPDAIQVVILAEERELKRREKAYRGNEKFPNLSNKRVILVDDGIATGATMRVAIKALRKLNPIELIVAVPVVQMELYETLKTLADEIISPLKPKHLHAVGEWYDDFSQTEDEEVYTLLTKARKLPLN